MSLCHSSKSQCVIVNMILQAILFLKTRDSLPGTKKWGGGGKHKIKYIKSGSNKNKRIEKGRNRSEKKKTIWKKKEDYLNLCGFS